MRDEGFDFYWTDPYTKNIFADGFEFKKGEHRVEVVTSFESFEHFINPLDEINKMLKIARHIFFSTTILQEPLPQPGRWSYFGFEHGQHIAFYSLKTLQFIASILNLHLYTSGGFLHMLSEKEIKPQFYKRVLNRSSIILRKEVRHKIKSKTETDSENLKRTLFGNN